ncbi:hypothetical protein [Pseudomonas sp. LB3P58]|jgi:hypothetical protein
MPTKNKLALKQQRAEQVNQAIHIIVGHGRRLFYDEVTNRYASMEVDQRGKVWLIDDYTGKRIFIHETVWGGKWRGFISHGGTLKETKISTYVLTYKKNVAAGGFQQSSLERKKTPKPLFSILLPYQRAKKSATQ